MSRIILADPQSTRETRTHYFDFNPDLPTGITVSGGTAYHTPPGGTATVITPGAAVAGVVPVTLPAPTATGTHRLQCVAALSSADTSDITLLIPVTL